MEYRLLGLSGCAVSALALPHHRGPERARPFPPPPGGRRISGGRF